MAKHTDYMKTEGDINLSNKRKKWQEEHLDAETFRRLDEDADLFMHQSLSSPCLNVVEKTYGIYMEDSSGKKYMDFHGNSVHQVGYGHETVIQAVKDQLDVLPFSPRRFTNDAAITFAKKLTAQAPGALNKVLFAPGGTSALSMALKLVRKVTGRFKTVSMWDAFHGASLDAISVGGEAAFRTGMGPLLPGAIHVLPYNGYRSPFGNGRPDVDSLDYLAYVLEREREVGAVIMEPIRCTDVHIPPAAYFERLEELREEHGFLLIFDEIPTALGRTGKMFACEHFPIIPDIILVGKGLGGGIFPMAGIIVREDLDEAGDIALGHFTHEKSSIGCAAGLATLQVIEKEGLLDAAVQLGEYMRQRLQAMQENYALIGDVRGIGLLYGVELVLDRQTKVKATEEAEEMMYSCMAKGLSFKVSQGNVLTLAPPLTITQEELTEAMDMLEAALAELAS